MPLTPLELARVAAVAADAKKAEDLVLIDLTEVSDVCDYFLVVSAANARQADTLVDEVKVKVEANCGETPISVEGRAQGTWILMDYGALVVHVFQREARDYYRLERLWGDAPRVRLGLDSELAEEAGARDGAEPDPLTVSGALAEGEELEGIDPSLLG